MRHASKSQGREAGRFSQSAGGDWVEGGPDLCFCKECRVERHELTLTEASDDADEVASFRASPKFRDESGLEEFLRENSLQSLHPIFEEHQVTLGDLHLLTRDDLADMKVPIGPRNRLLSALERSKSPSLRQSQAEPVPGGAREHELDSPKQHSAPSVKPVTPEKPPLGAPLSPDEVDNPVQLRRRALRHEVEVFLQEVEDLFSRRQRRVTREATEAPSAASQGPSPPSASSEQLALLQSLITNKQSLEKGFESLLKSVSEMKEARSVSPRPVDSLVRALGDSPQRKPRKGKMK